MKKNIFILLIIILTVIFQTSVIPLCFSERNIPDFVLIEMVSAVAVFGFQLTWIWVIIAGIILDLFSFSALGFNVFPFIFFSYATSFFSRRLILGEKIGGILVGTIFVFLMTFLNNFWIQLIGAGFKFQKIQEINGFFLESTGWKMILNLILFFLCILFFKRIKKKLSPSNNLLLEK
ncbi:MAG: rod shape-determining protein MreD [Parcubacteria group bacterium]|jgi:rod shape-determining protein MreD